MQASWLSLGPALCLPRSHNLTRRNRCLDCGVDIELYMSVLLLRDYIGGVCTRFDQSSHCCLEVVHRKDPLLISL
ncbi:hypothetical protein JRO89_XS06G0055600 [Xanthoceras sorbifolium]|uniref:Secreted protein n=1 Tax=Xanthoceras sorbifolium TaxID=99658 RepID=A0ABQ8HWX4_9ROSI|nr:hypothetical protein JRO89_XS06G0055600 [Xanthoceras sorbifolium]